MLILGGITCLAKHKGNVQTMLQSLFIYSISEASHLAWLTMKCLITTYLLLHSDVFSLLLLVLTSHVFYKMNAHEHQHKVIIECRN